MRVVVVGYGMAGARLSAELVARGRDVKVTAFGAETHPAYNRILLSSVLAGRAREEDLTLAAPPSGVDVRLGVAVTGIDAARRVVGTPDGEEEYDALVLATGSRAVVPPVPGLSGAAVFRTLDDCRRIVAGAGRARTALVLGGGLLGLEAARGLAGRGLDVTVVHAAGHLMERQLDADAAAVLSATLRGLGVRVLVDAQAVERVDGGLRLADGRVVTADLLVVACGVRPETALAERAGLAVGHGVVVDDGLLTSAPDVYAIGDCVEHRGTVYGLVAPAWEQAAALADRLTGGDSRYTGSRVVTRLKAGGIDLAAMGSLEPAGAEVLSFADPARGTYAKLVVRQDRLAGAVLLGDNPAVGTVVQLFDRAAPVPADRRTLLLGRSLGGGPAAVAESPALMPDRALVCRCNSVTKAAVTACWRGGTRDVAGVAAATRATTGCGSCRDAVAGILDWLSTVDPGSVR